MTDGEVDGGGQKDLPAPSPSSRVDLEAALLASDPRTLAARHGEDAGPSRARIVMIIAIDPDTRYYVRECLLARPNLRVIEVPTQTIGEQLAVHLHPDLLIVDGLGAGKLPPGRVIVLADDRPLAAGQPLSAQPEGHVWLARPFNAAALVALVDQMLAVSSKP